MTDLSIAIRVIHLVASLMLTGLFTFLLLVARPAFQAGKSEDRSALNRFDLSLLRLACYSLLVLLTTGLLGLWVQLATVTDRPLFQALAPEALWNMLTGTQYGRVWTVRMALMVLLGSFLWWHERERDRRDWWALRLEILGLAVSTHTAQAWMGHAVAGEGVVLVYQVLADSLHLLAAGVWWGALPLLAFLLSWAQRTDDPHAGLVAAEAVRRFSTLGLVSVSVLILSGLGNAWGLVGTVPALVGTAYGRLLLLKVSLLLPLMIIAARNLLHEKPRLLQLTVEAARSETPRILQHLRRNVSGEIILGGMILLVVGVLGVLPPAAHEQPTWPFSFRLSWEATKDLPGVRTSVAIGIQVSMFGFFAALIALIMRARRWPWIAAAGLVAVGVGFVLWLPKLAVDAYPTTYLRPSVTYDALSIANGLHLYSEHCATCHGPEGYGDGPAAAALRPRPADLTAKHTADHTAGDMFWWLTYGIRSTAMPGFQTILSEEERWDLINVVRALSAAELARLLGPRVSPDLRIIAPDFTYTTSLGNTRALKDFRGRDQVLLVFYSLPQSRPRLVQLQEIYAQVRPLDVEVLAIPLGPEDAIDIATADGPFPFPLVRDGASETSATYTLFRRSLAAQEAASDDPMPAHVEFLVDRGGFLRGRWIPAESVGWSDPKELLAAIDVLREEKLDALPPDLHVH
jgi:copper resistance protein D